ncbi:MAG: alcohol dehydrogenase catalytic domain-containing protein [Sphingomonadaceae bacterium]
MKMKAAVFEKPGVPLAISEVEVPKPAAGQLLIRVHRCGICGSDLHLTDPHSCWTVKAGTVLGHEFSGEIVELGAGTDEKWREGDRLAGFPYIGCGTCAACLGGEPFHCPTVLSLPTGDLVGGYGEYAVVGADESVRLHDGVSWEQGAMTEPLAVGIHAVAVSRMRPGVRVLVLGAGPVGLATAAVAKMMGADSVVVTARTDRRAELATTLGADAFHINDEYLAERFAKTAGGPPEIIFECVGLPGMMGRCSDLVTHKGQIVMAGACNGFEKFLAITPTVKELNYQFAACYTKQEFAVAQKMIASGQIDLMPMFDGLVPMNDLPTVFEQLRADKSACKVMLNPMG